MFFGVEEGEDLGDIGGLCVCVCVESLSNVDKTTVYIGTLFQERAGKKGRSLMKTTLALVPVKMEDWRKKRKGTNRRLMER